MEHAYGKGGMTGSTWNAYDRRMPTPLLRCAPLATPHGRRHGIHDEQVRRGAGSGSPFSFWRKNLRPLSRYRSTTVSLNPFRGECSPTAVPQTQTNRLIAVFVVEI